jgi:hypothetical protein
MATVPPALAVDVQPQRLTGLHAGVHHRRQAPHGALDQRPRAWGRQHVLAHTRVQAGQLPQRVVMVRVAQRGR